MTAAPWAATPTFAEEVGQRGVAARPFEAAQRTVYTPRSGSSAVAGSLLLEQVTSHEKVRLRDSRVRRLTRASSQDDEIRCGHLSHLGQRRFLGSSDLVNCITRDGALLLPMLLSRRVTPSTLGASLPSPPFLLSLLVLSTSPSALRSARL